ncbi:MAG TPA: amidohydrolase/deacetylase family metallohydrolase [Bryobacteraceae bacterium]|jgi:dihydroorotase|nr:amidohydrolase/deacetylase family metallohydrolase [Bryobacteraceae bacterium]
MKTSVLISIVLLGASAAAQDYDLLLKGGHVIDGRNKISGVRDVAIKDGKIAAVAARIDPAKAHKVVNVAGLYVTPGLVDIHVHVYAGTGQRGAYSGDNSVYPDGFTLRSGVTTVVDAGSSGWRNFPDFKDKVIDRSKTRVLALLNIVGKGMGGGAIEQDTGDMDAAATAAQAKKYKDTVVGVKTAHFSGPEWIAVDRAVEAGKAANIPVMVDFGTFRAERPFQDLVLKHLRPGDIYTHTYLGAVPMLDSAGKVNPYLFEARKRGIIFDVGHGGGSFLFRQAVPAVKQGFIPDSISTDLHIGSMNAGMKNMLNVMSKFLNIGMSLDEVILRSTWHPAREIKREEFGNLSVGSPADVAVLSLQKGNFGFVDIYGARMKGAQKLVCEATLRDGMVVYDLNGITREDWNKLGNYGSQGDRRWDGTLSESVRARKK